MTESVRKIHERSVFIHARATRFVDSLEGTVKNPTTVKSPTNAIIEHVPVILYGGRTRTSALVLVSECSVRFRLILFDHVRHFTHGFKDSFPRCCARSLDEPFP